MNTMNLHQELHRISASAQQPKLEKPKSLRERRKEQREAARTAKRNGLQQAIAAKNNQRKAG